MITNFEVYTPTWQGNDKSETPFRVALYRELDHDSYREITRFWRKHAERFLAGYNDMSEEDRRKWLAANTDDAFEQDSVAHLQLLINKGFAPQLPETVHIEMPVGLRDVDMLSALLHVLNNPRSLIEELAKVVQDRLLLTLEQIKNSATPAGRAGTSGPSAGGNAPDATLVANEKAAGEKSTCTK